MTVVSAQARVAALCRHPVKGFTPEPVADAHLTAGGWFPGDRMYAVEDGPVGYDPAAPAPIPQTPFAGLFAPMACPAPSHGRAQQACRLHSTGIVSVVSAAAVERARAS